MRSADLGKAPASEDRTNNQNVGEIATPGYSKDLINRALNLFLAHRSKAKELWYAVSKLQEIREPLATLVGDRTKCHAVIPLSDQINLKTFFQTSNEIRPIAYGPINSISELQIKLVVLGMRVQSGINEFLKKLENAASARGLRAENLGLASDPRSISSKSPKTNLGLNSLEQENCSRAQCFKISKLWTKARKSEFKALMDAYELFRYATNGIEYQSFEIATNAANSHLTRIVRNVPSKPSKQDPTEKAGLALTAAIIKCKDALAKCLDSEPLDPKILSDWRTRKHFSDLIFVLSVISKMHEGAQREPKRALQHSTGN
jgi:hypothetical protein